MTVVCGPLKRRARPLGRILHGGNRRVVRQVQVAVDVEVQPVVTALRPIVDRRLGCIRFCCLFVGTVCRARFVEHKVELRCQSWLPRGAVEDNRAVKRLLGVQLGIGFDLLGGLGAERSDLPAEYGELRDCSRGPSGRRARPPSCRTRPPCRRRLCCRRRSSHPAALLLAVSRGRTARCRAEKHKSQDSCDGPMASFHVIASFSAEMPPVRELTPIPPFADREREFSQRRPFSCPETVSMRETRIGRH